MASAGLIFMLLESLPATARRSLNRFLPNDERGLLEACEERKAHGNHHVRDK